MSTLGKKNGEIEIRTLEGLAPLTVFETAPFNHSGISPNIFIRVILTPP